MRPYLLPVGLGLPDAPRRSPSESDALLAKDRLVAELRRAGEIPAATSVATLPRPTPMVWAINQVAHGDRESGVPKGRPAGGPRPS
jgi:hypothetical protein